MVSSHLLPSVCLLQVPLVIVDSIFYGKLTFTTANIIMYNVFSAGGGSQLYGKGYHIQMH